MSAIHTKSLTGITSITTPSGVDNVFTVHSNDTTERFRVDLNGNQSIAGILTVAQDLDVDGHTNLDNVSIAGVTTFSDDVTFTGASSNIVFDKSSNQIKFNDNAKIRLGTDNDANIRHDGSNMWVQNSTGYIYMDASSTAIRFISQASWASGAMAAFNNNGSVQLYYDAQQKFYTTASGINVVGTTDTDGLVVSGVTTMTGNLTISNTDPQLAIHDTNHNPSHYYLKGVSGAFKITDSTNGDRISLNANGSISITAGTTVFSGAAQVSTNLGVTGNLILSDQIIHSGDDNTKIRFPAADTIQFETNGDNRLYINNSALYVKSGFPLAFLASSGATPNIKSGGTNNQDLLFTTGSGNPTRLSITSGGAVMINTTNSSSRTLNLNGTFGILSTNQSGVIDMSVTDAGEASIGPYVAGGSSLILKTNSSGSGVAERLRISSAGYVTKPNHPSFCARHQASDGFSGDVIVLTRISTSWDVWNTGGHYSTTTGKFTAPVTGVYYFEGQVMSTGHSNGDNIQDMLSLESNRGRIAYCRQRESYFSSATNANGYYTNSVGGSTRLSSGDTVWIQRHSSQNWSYSNRYYSYFTGWLIG